MFFIFCVGGGGMGEIEIFLWYTCFSTESLENLCAFATGVPFFWRSCWKNTLGTTHKTMTWACFCTLWIFMVFVVSTTRLWLHSPSRKFEQAVLTNRRCSLCAKAGRWCFPTLKPSKLWGRLSRWRCMVPFRDASNMAKPQWMKTPTTLHCRRLWEAMWTCTKRVMCLWSAIDSRQGMTTAPWHCLGLIARDFVYTNIIAWSLQTSSGFCVVGFFDVGIFSRFLCRTMQHSPPLSTFEALRFFYKLIYVYI